MEELLAAIVAICTIQLVKDVDLKFLELMNHIFVIAIDANKNQIVVGTKDELERGKIMLNSLNLYTNESEFDCDVKVRYRSIGLNAHVKVLKDNKAQVELKQSAFGVAVGNLRYFTGDD